VAAEEQQMTTDKARKRAVRTRMSKTGESYTAARRHVAKAAPLPPRIGEPETSDEAVRRATGRGWDDWFRILDERGLEGFSHTETARWLATEHPISGWWAQSVTVGYERARGLRAVHQTGDGFSVTVSKTVPVGIEALRTAFVDGGLRDRWLEPGTVTPRTTTARTSMRFDFRTDGSRIGAYFTDLGPAKASVAIQHEKLASAEEVEAMRSFWRGRLAVLAMELRRA
jgi:hypothetical protein